MNLYVRFHKWVGFTSLTCLLLCSISVELVCGQSTFKAYDQDGVSLILYSDLIKQDQETVGTDVYNVYVYNITGTVTNNSGRRIKLPDGFKLQSPDVNCTATTATAYELGVSSTCLPGQIVQLSAGTLEPGASASTSGCYISRCNPFFPQVYLFSYIFLDDPQPVAANPPATGRPPAAPAPKNDVVKRPDLPLPKQRELPNISTKPSGFTSVGDYHQPKLTAITKEELDSIRQNGNLVQIASTAATGRAKPAVVDGEKSTNSNQLTSSDDDDDDISKIDSSNPEELLKWTNRQAEKAIKELEELASKTKCPATAAAYRKLIEFSRCSLKGGNCGPPPVAEIPDCPDDN